VCEAAKFIVEFLFGNLKEITVSFPTDLQGEFRREVISLLSQDGIEYIFYCMS
jgi:hypothetical protein